MCAYGATSGKLERHFGWLARNRDPSGAWLPARCLEIVLSWSPQQGQGLGPIAYNGPRKQTLSQVGRAWTVDRFDSDQTGRHLYGHNSLGYRSAEFNPHAAFIAFVFGESDAFGLGVNSEDIWAIRVAYEAARAAGFSPAETCIVNFSESGASNSAIARQLVSQCSRVQPDLVLIQLAEDRRVELLDDVSGWNGGPWFEHPEVEEQVRSAADLSDEERDRLLSMISRGRSFLDFCTPYQGLHSSLRDLLLMQECTRRLGLDALAIGRESERFRTPSILGDTRLGPLAQCIERDFLVDVPAAKTFANDTSGVDAHHMGPVGHLAIAEYLIARLPTPRHRAPQRMRPTDSNPTSIDSVPRGSVSPNGVPSNVGDSLGIPFYESPLLEKKIEQHSAMEQKLIRTFAERGYLVLDDAILDIDEKAESIVHGLQGHYPDLDRRVAEAWYFEPAVRDLACAPRILEVLRLLYGREPIPFQTLNFDAGSEQAAHSDEVHFSSEPRHFMAGAWIALEDTDDDNGPIVVYPGSHLLPDLGMAPLGLPSDKSAYSEYETRIAELMESLELERHEVRMRKGQVLIWATNLIHAGAANRDATRTRHSQVTHYFFDDGLYYFPMTSEPLAGRTTIREVIDIRTGQFVTHRYGGRDVHLQDYEDVWTYERPLPEWVEQRTAAAPRSESPTPRLLEHRIRQLTTTVDSLREVKETFADLREGYARLERENYNLQMDNRAKETFITKRDSELLYKIARRLTKAARSLIGR